MQQKYSVLIVDDEPDFSETLAKMFSRRNISVDTADSCEMAMAKLEKMEFEVVIMDVSMPGINGIQCLGMVKERWPAAEVIILTGHASVSTGIEGMKCGAFDYCLKPIDLDELLEKMELAAEKAGLNRL